MPAASGGSNICGMEDSEIGFGDVDRSGRVITRDESYAAAAVFCFVHRDCGEAVFIGGGEASLVCRCERCGDERTYVIAEPGTEDKRPA